MAPATSAAAIAAPHPLDATKFPLTVDLTGMASDVAAYERQLGTAPVPVRNLVANEGATQTCNAGEKDAVKLVNPAPATLRCWAGADRDNDYMPQGVTSTSDASSTNFYDGRQALAVTSYQDGTALADARVTFLPNFGNEGYLHIRLFDPALENGGNVNCHAGGSVWYGHYLMVACTGKIKVFDWRKIYKVSGKHIMLQVGTIDGPAISAFSSLGLDRASDPDLLVVSQHETTCKPQATNPGGNECSVFRYELRQADTLTHGPLSAYDAFNTMVASMQGAVSQRNQFWFSSSDGKSNAGKLRTWTKGTTAVREKDWTTGAESVSHWNRGARPGVLLSVTEYPNKRVILSVETTDYP